MKFTPLVSIIILNYNGQKFIESCLESILGTEYPPDKKEIIVVDNASTDDSCQLIKQRFSQQVVLIESEENLGFSKGNNLGAKHASGDMLLFLNNDTIVHKQLIMQLVAAAQPKDVAAVCPKTYLHGTKKVQNAGSIVFHDGYSRDRGAIVADDREQTYEEDNQYFNTKSDVLAFSGVCMLIKTDIFYKAGKFSAQYFMYYEDIDLSLMIQRLGYQIIFEPKATLSHHHSASSKEWSSFFIYHVERGRLLLLWRHFPLSVAITQTLQFIGRIGFFSIVGLKQLAARYIKGSRRENHSVNKIQTYSKILLSLVLNSPKTISYRIAIQSIAPFTTISKRLS